MFVIGETVTLYSTVTEELTAQQIGSGDLPVYATPMMIALMENAAATLVKMHISEQESSVGTALNIAHTKASAIGEDIRAIAMVKGFEGRAIEFEVVALNSSDQIIGKGTHTRFIVNREKFLGKL